MTQYTAKDLKNISKAELVDLLKKEGIEFDQSMPYFTLRSLLLNKNEDSMKKETKKNDIENIEQPVEIKSEETVIEQPVETNVETNVEEVVEEVKPEPQAAVKEEPKKEVHVNKLSSLRGEIIKRKGGKGLGTSAFAAELAKRKGERVSGATFAQELKNRQLKYGNK